MIVRNPWTTATGPVQASGGPALGDYLADPTPTTVQLADGTSYVIPSGVVGTFAWVRQANLLSVAYQQLGDPNRSTQWQLEYQKRLNLWYQAQEQEDQAMLLAASVPDWMLAPVKIVKTLAGWIEETGRTAQTLALSLPVVALAALLVIGVGFNKKQLRVRHGY